MKTLNRLTDVYPYSRDNAETLIKATKDFLEANRGYKILANSFVKPGDELKFTVYVEDLLVGELTDEIDNIITKSFPELLPVEWDAYLEAKS
ncbi:hypothetical protein [Hellea balneolensis]|uniref:hypothetical protein n=1 Tax=Hellea balneolensis TaxID=287478 RepID=UPI0004093150|nr:hypothetical protein [Hellea balneolensis]